MNPDEDDDRTVFASAEPPVEAPPDNALPVGTRLGEFEIVSLIGIGGFGIVYLALDHSLGRRIALKEYMPQSLALRGSGAQVTVRSSRHAATFEAGLRSFVNEAKLLARFDHPSLVKVYRFWEENGTAYMVMPFYEGRTLKEVLKERPQPPDEAWLKRMLSALLDALDEIHAAHVCHRDIAPDNILLLSGDRPLLLDFGAARHVITDMTQALTVILKPGYAPIEQYADGPDLKQGVWTDLYALAAVAYFAIARKTPVPSVGRMLNDPLVPLAQLAAGRHSDAFLRGIDRGLAVKPGDRPQTIDAFRALLALPSQAPFKAGAPTDEAPPRAAVGGSPRIGRGGMAGLAAAAVVSAIAGTAYWITREEPRVRTAVVANAPAVAPPVPDATPKEAPRAEAPPAPFDPLNAIDRIFEQRDRQHSVNVTLPKSHVTIGSDKLRFTVRSSKGGYLYVLMVGTDRQHFYMLFPNQVDQENRIDAGGSVKLLREGSSLVADGPPGADRLIAFVSESRRDFKAAGLVAVEEYAEFPLEAAARVALDAGDGASPFVGKVVCPGGAVDCPNGYGAAAFTIEEVQGPRR